MADRLEPAAFAHPVFEPIRPWLARALAGGWPAPEALTSIARELRLTNARGLPIAFADADTLAPADYELRIDASGVVAMRQSNCHDLLNALAWMAFPRTKSAINALHAVALPAELAQRRPGRSQPRSRLRDALTLLDEGGALVAVSDAALEPLAREHRWVELFWERRDAVRQGLRFAVLGHAVLEQALEAHPRLTCRAIFVPVESSALDGPCRSLVERLDAAAAGWLAAQPALAPPLLPPLPVFGYPGWLPGSGDAAFYADQRYFRPLRTAAGGHAA